MTAKCGELASSRARRRVGAEVGVLFGTALAFLLALGPAADAVADSRPVSYALLIGSTKAGPGQEALRYAHRDATRLADVLDELGAYPRSHLTVLRDPSPKGVFEALNAIAAKLKSHQQRDQKTRFLFYYSGHARARALNLGTDEVPLERLRAQLEAMPATVTLAILDACQTGAISGVKGAFRAPDFSYHSIDELEMSGVAVIASSSASEYSQEAKELRSSYFTHHLVVALRGAADRDGDGRVTLDEAYRYAYHRTLIDTSKTAVGKQHPTLETKLTGMGDMVLSEPRIASSSLVLPKKESADLLIVREDVRHVVAEVHKAGGSEVRLALPPGRYRAMLSGRDQRHLECRFELRRQSTTTFDRSACRPIAQPTATPKGAELNPGPAPHARTQWTHLSMELGLGLSLPHNGDYAQTLEDYGYERDGYDLLPNLQLTALLHLSRHFAVGLGAAYLGPRHFYRSREVPFPGLPSQETPDSRYSWTTYGLFAALRASYPIQQGLVIPYAELDLGLSLADREMHATG